MPAKKPPSLIDRHDTKADRSARADAESAMTPKTELTRKPPAKLTGHKIAIATWKHAVGLYAETTGKIATSFDENLLVKYCLVEEECVWLEKIRLKIEKLYVSTDKKLAKMKPDDLEAYYKALSQVNALLTRLQGFDARLDGKRKLSHTMEMSLYLTPRSRAGVAPPTKEPETPLSPMEKMLRGKD